MARPSDSKIEEQADAASDQLDEGGSKWPGMSYEQGVNNALNWVLGNDDMPPMEDEG